jgi:hypothetical protein
MAQPSVLTGEQATHCIHVSNSYSTFLIDREPVRAVVTTAEVYGVVQLCITLYRAWARQNNSRASLGSLRSGAGSLPRRIALGGFQNIAAVHFGDIR